MELVDGEELVNVGSRERNSRKLIHKKELRDIGKQGKNDRKLPLSSNKFFAEFMDCIIPSLINIFSGYDKVELFKESRDFTAFMTFLGLIQMITLT